MFNTPSLSASQQAQRYIWLSVVAAVATITLKLIAWQVSGSVGLFSDAMESFVNLGSALFALYMIRLAHEPPDDTHPFGHSKAEYFSSAFEGTMITIAALLILQSAIPRLMNPQPLEQIGMGIWFSLASTAINFGVAMLLKKAGHRLRSIALAADSRHLMTDVWTTAGVIIGLVAVMLTGWLWLDAVLAIGVAIHILAEGYRLLKESFSGLMDQALPQEEIEKIENLLKTYKPRGVYYKKLKTRASASQRFVVVNILVPAAWQVGEAHDLADEIEKKIAETLNGAIVTTHLEPVEWYQSKA